jgi:phenylalanyl-tRNA synthetase beta chain
MKVPMSWLRDHLRELPVSTRELAERLAITGVEVERIARRGLPAVDGNGERVVAGLVLEAGKHPNADRLQLCRVDTGDPEPRQIVCGAWNFAAGDTVAVALPGLVMPDGRTLEPAKLRGAVSNGMILSERELELSSEHSGILVLGEGYAPGEPLGARLALSEEVLELEVSSNRSDLLSVRGVARDVAAVFDLELVPLDEREPEATGDRTTAAWVRIASDDVDLCPRFCARVFQDVRVGPSPLWLKGRLMAAGIRPISNVVDVTNYVMHDLGNPLHAYDHAKVAGPELVARRARAGERIVTLDEKERELAEGMLVIADAEGPAGVAGIMGGARTEISDDSQTVVLEAANFTRVQVMRTSLALGLRTDGSNRWEKGVDPYLAPVAARAAARLILEVAPGARLAPEPIDVCAALPQRARLHLRESRLEAVTGIRIPPDEVTGILDRLGFEPARTADGWDAVVPTPRWLDVTREIDLVEEAARVHGLDKVPSRLPRGAHEGGLSEPQRVRRAIADAAVGAGLVEAVTPAFLGSHWADRLGLGAGDPRRSVVEIENPISSEHSVMRPLLLPSLLDAVARNVALGRADASLVEIAHVYLPREGELLPDEPWTLGGLLCGRLGGEGWRRSGEAASFFVAKGVLEVLLRVLDLDLHVAVELGRDPFLHPGRSCRVVVAGEDVGFLGELHPLVAERFELPGAPACFEIDLDRVTALQPPLAVARLVPEAPPLHQDLAFIVGDEHPAAALVTAAREAGGELLVSVRVFDVYRDPAVLGDGRRSVALHLTFQAEDRTLTDEEVRPLRERIVATIEERFGARLRA